MKLSCNSLSIDLRHYLLRKSKKSTEDEIICCLEAIDKFEPSIIRFVFVRGNRTEQYNRLLKYF